MMKGMAQPIRIVTRDTTLRRVLARILERSGRFAVTPTAGFPSQPNPEELVVAPVGDCSLRRCEALAAAGGRVIVLAAVPRRAEQEQYLEAGAVAYLPMDPDGKALMDALANAGSAGQREPECAAQPG